MRFLALLALSFLVPTVVAQPTDSLDWHRYYPLAVGNLWEYHDAEAYGDQFRHTLVSDTVANGRTYYRRRTDRALAVFGPSGPDTLRSSAYDFVRYDDAGGVVAVASVADDAAGVEPCADDGFERDLRLGFGARLACDPPPPSLPDADSVFVEGEVGTVWAPEVLEGAAESVAVAAVKRYVVGGFIFSEFVADVGPVRTGNLWGPSLHYAVVGGVEYGGAGFVVNAESGALARPALEVRVLGNPTRGRAAFDVRAPSPERAVTAVYDVLGREVWRGEIAIGSDWRRVEVPAARLASGRYVFSVSGSAGRSTKAFTVVK